MKENYSDDTFLARWLSGKLSSQEEETFKNTSDFVAYKKIIAAMEHFERPEFDQKAVFNNITKATSKKIKVKRLIPYWTYAIASLFVIAIGINFFLSSTTAVTTGFGEQVAVNLPDGSLVKLNAKSAIEFDEKSWENERKVTLNGEAFFEVTKGSSFSVVTDQGTVTVLGTKFNVKSEEKYFEVRCHEGKVKVSPSIEKEVLLERGNGVRILDNNVEQLVVTTDQPDWILGESSFDNVPLKYVIEALEKQYQINFEKENIDSDARYTGSFTHKNLTLALQTVFDPMEIKYTFKNKNKVVLLKG
ncbi:FecR family protein [Aquimarina rhabdastrellae]